MKCFLLAVLIGCAAAASAQQRLLNRNVQELRSRLRELQLTIDQKRRLMRLIHRERLQYYLNQKELNDILTEKQKVQLMNWRNQRNGNKKDSTLVSN